MLHAVFIFHQLSTIILLRGGVRPFLPSDVAPAVNTFTLDLFQNFEL